MQNNKLPLILKLMAS